MNPHIVAFIALIPTAMAIGSAAELLRLAFTRSRPAYAHRTYTAAPQVPDVKSTLGRRRFPCPPNVSRTLERTH